jgi:hypothetical protein
MRGTKFSICLTIGLAIILAAAAFAAEAPQAKVRPPAVPLIAHDPYFSVWSFGDELTADLPRHWTGRIQALTSMIRIDGKSYRLMGSKPEDVPAAKQLVVRVLPTQSFYLFEQDGVALALTFTSPLLPNNLDLFSRPVTYLTWKLKATDGKTHDVALYYDNSAELVVNEPDQEVVWSRPEAKGLTVMKIGSKDQPVLKEAGDDRRIDWGYQFVAVPSGEGVSTVIGSDVAARTAFAKDGTTPNQDDKNMPRPASKDWPVLACAIQLGKVGAESVSRHILIAYDDEYSIEYLGAKLHPYWRRNGMDATQMLETAEREYADVCYRCDVFDTELRADATTVGGPDYADFCAHAYRVAMAGHKLTAAPDGRPLMFSKENFSNGCVGTVDVIYPAAPIFMLLSNELLKASVTPVFDYAATPRWKFPFAPHDVGTYPKANGQVYGGGEETEDDQMPVEESGDMIIMAAVISQLDGNTNYVEKYWPQISRWAAYLKEKGLDPPNQLCTDDFAGHLAHNANLSIKAIVALAAYAEMCNSAGKVEEAAEYRKLAEQFAAQWMKMADDGDHYRLAFDKPGTWSQKYNLVWDKLLGLNLFPPELAAKELAFYKTKLNRYGLPLDNRKGYTKTDWQVWTATLAPDRATFDALMQPVYAFANNTPDRIPLTDWYETGDAKCVGFRARPVIGGVFIKFLDDKAVWKKWADGK